MRRRVGLRLGQDNGRIFWGVLIDEGASGLVFGFLALYAAALVQEGVLNEVEEVFHLRLEELEDLGRQWPPSAGTIRETRDLVARRNALRKNLAGNPLFDPRLLKAASQIPDGKDVLLRGTSGSPGLARGPARIVHDISEFGKLQAGDVLVAPVTNPAWTPLFQRAAAVVVDTGGSASHAAIVARV